MKKILIIQRVIPDYRVSFFVELEKQLRTRGIVLSLIAGKPPRGRAVKECRDELSFVVKTDNINFCRAIYWMRRAISEAKKYDLVIFEQANGALHLHGIFLRRFFRQSPKIAFWGHGANLNKSQPHLIRDTWRNYWSGKVDWWFAYTDRSVKLVAECGFPRDRITNVQNAIDTSELRVAREQLGELQIKRVREDLFGDSSSALTGVFCGRLVALKWIPFLLESLAYIKCEIPSFRMIIVGDGPAGYLVEDFCKSNSWCVHVGAQHGKDRVPYLAQGDLWLNPGMTGLSILDAFALGLPFLTTENGIHSPEIEYLQPGVNGNVCRAEIKAFADMAVALLKDTACLERLKSEALSSGKKYTIHNMAENMAHGIELALNENMGTHRL